MRVIKGHRIRIIYFGPWACAIQWHPSARFGNGSRWFSGWSRWREWDL